MLWITPIKHVVNYPSRVISLLTLVTITASWSEQKPWWQSGSFYNRLISRTSFFCVFFFFPPHPVYSHSFFVYKYHKAQTAAPQLELNECKQPWLGQRWMSGTAKGGGSEIDRLGGEERRREAHIHLATNNLSTANFELKRPNTFKNTEMRH